MKTILETRFFGNGQHQALLEKPDQYRVSNTNGNSRQHDAVRIYRNNKLIAKTCPPQRNPLNYIRTHQGRYRTDLTAQLFLQNVPYEIISQIIQ